MVQTLDTSIYRSKDNIPWEAQVTMALGKHYHQTFSMEREITLKTIKRIFFGFKNPFFLPISAILEGKWF